MRIYVKSEFDNPGMRRTCDEISGFGDKFKCRKDSRSFERDYLQLVDGPVQVETDDGYLHHCDRLIEPELDTTKTFECVEKGIKIDKEDISRISDDEA